MGSCIVLDKSFLFAVKTALFRELCNSNEILTCDAALYELAKTPEPERGNCLGKFGGGFNSIVVTEPIGAMLDFEFKNHTRAGLPSKFRLPGNCRFNSTALNGTFEAQPNFDAIIKDKSCQVKRAVERLVSATEEMPKMFPHVVIGKKDTLTEAEIGISIPGNMLQYYSTFEPPEPDLTYPPVSKISENWAIYRFMQVEFLFALDVYFRQNGSLPQERTNKIQEKLEHDVLDAEQLVLGCLQGAFATNESKLARWFKLLCPRGRLVSVNYS